MLNIKFEYLYRDEGNYKTFGDIVFSNPNQLTVEHINESIESHLIEGCWFDPDAWQIPRFSFHRFNAFGIYDYLWYEFEAISFSDEAPVSLSITDFLNLIAIHR
jgi:hypothetical protein